MKTHALPLSTSSLLRLIDEARDAELCRNINQSLHILDPVWEDIESDPDYTAFSDELRAELLRLSGFFLVFSGKSQNKPHYQMRGKDLLTTAIDLFVQLDAPDKAAEAKVMLALSYWYCGEVEECDVILSTVEAEFDGNSLHPVWLQIRVNRLMVLGWSGKLDEAISIVNDLAVPMEFCKDLRLLSMYHNQAAVIFWYRKVYDKAIFHMNEAARKARVIHNLRFVGLNLNNLAVIYQEIGRFELAHRSVREAMAIFEDLKDIGWIPHVLDSQALIFLGEKRFTEALASINSAIDLFRHSEDTAGLVESLWTRCLCLFRLGRKDEAFASFAELHQTASARIGVSATSKYLKALSIEIYGPGDAAAAPDRPADLEQIARVPISSRFRFPAGASDDTDVYFIPAAQARHLGIGAGLLAVHPVSAPAADMTIFYRSNGLYRLAVVNTDPDLGLLYVDTDGDMCLLDEISILGVPFAHFPADDLDGGTIDFLPF